MDENLVASIRKNLESKATEELRLACEAADKTAKPPEELEAMRQILDERRMNGNRIVLALASAVLIGTIASAGAWWQLGPDLFVLLAGIGGAVLGFASWYIPGLISGQ